MKYYKDSDYIDCKDIDDSDIHLIVKRDATIDIESKSIDTLYIDGNSNALDIHLTNTNIDTLYIKDCDISKLNIDIHNISFIKLKNISCGVVDLRGYVDDIDIKSSKIDNLNIFGFKSNLVIKDGIYKNIKIENFGSFLDIVGEIDNISLDRCISDTSIFHCKNSKKERATIDKLNVDFVKSCMLDGVDIKNFNINKCDVLVLNDSKVDKIPKHTILTTHIHRCNDFNFSILSNRKINHLKISCIEQDEIGISGIYTYYTLIDDVKCNKLSIIDSIDILNTLYIYNSDINYIYADLSDDIDIKVKDSNIDVIDSINLLLKIDNIKYVESFIEYIKKIYHSVDDKKKYSILKDINKVKKIYSDIDIVGL